MLMPWSELLPAVRCGSSIGSTGSAAAQRFLRRAVVVVAFFVVIVLLLHWRGSDGGALGQSLPLLSTAAKEQLMSLEPTCEGFFARGGTCDQQNTWECINGDDSQAFLCCCGHGYGNFRPATGLISLASKPSACLDLDLPATSMVFPWQKSYLVLGDCARSDSNARLHFNVSGLGQIRWATHPKKCLGIENGANYDGNQISLQDCDDSDPEWTQFQMAAGWERLMAPHHIRWAKHPDKCLDTTPSPGDMHRYVRLHECNGVASSQLLSVRPVTRETAAAPSLFCVTLVLPFGNEPHIIAAQKEMRIGIFLCDTAEVYSAESITLPPGLNSSSDVMASGGRARDRSLLGAGIFIQFWDLVIADPRSNSYTWTVKVDPNTVFLPGRLREVLRHLYSPQGDGGTAVFLNNCHLGMHVPIEVLSRMAVSKYRSQKHVCTAGLVNSTWVLEGPYLSNCLLRLQVPKVDAFNLLMSVAMPVENGP